MSEEEMQFADPDWQPPERRTSAPGQEPFHPQPVDAPRDEGPGWPSPPQGESDAASEYYAGYRARQQRSYSVRAVVSVLVVLLCVAFSIGTGSWFLTHQAPTPQPPKSPDPTLVTNLQDDGVGSLRWAIANAPAGSTITFAGSLRGTISRPSSTPTNGRDILIGRNLTIRGPGAGVLAISGGNAGRVFDVSKGVIVTISNLTIKNGEPGEGYPNGGGIYNEGTLTLTNSSVSSNSASTSGGGIYNGGRLTLTNSSVSGNRAPAGADIAVKV